MKHLFFCFMLSVLWSSCYQYYPSTYENYQDGVQQSQFTSIPIKPSVEKVKVIFPGEKFPEEPYLKVDVIDAFGNTSTSTQDMISVLQDQAKTKGMDAIIIISRDNISEIFQNEFSEEYTITTQKLSALGIKFIKNIDYLDDCIKGGTIIKWDREKEEFTEKTTFKSDWKGNLVELGSGEKFYYDFLYNFSLQHLANEKNSDWSYIINSLSPAEQIIKRVKRDPSGRVSFSKEVKLTMVYDRITLAQIKSNYNSIYSGKVDFYYNKDNQLIKKNIYSKGLGHFQQIFGYNENGVLSELEVFDMREKDPILHFKVVYENYQQSNLVQLLEED